MLNILELYNKYKSYIQFGGIGALIIFIYNGIFQSFITNVLFFFYLTYKSMKLLQSNNQDIQLSFNLLKRWVCYSCYIISEKILDISFTILPFLLLYNILKILFFLWIIKGESNVLTIYDILAVPFFEKYSEILDQIQSVLEQLVELYKTQVSSFIKTNYNNIKRCIFNYIKDLIREKIVKKEDIEAFFLDLKQTTEENEEKED